MVPKGTVAHHAGPGKLKCKYIIHAVGPKWWPHCLPVPDLINMLHATVYSTLKRADELKCESVSIPAISSGQSEFPKSLCAKVFFLAIKQFVADAKEEEKEVCLKFVRLTNFDSETTEIFQR